MRVLFTLLLLTGAYPLWCAWRANRRTSLTHALAWATSAWFGWSIVQVVGAGALVPVLRYLALALTGCAEVAVLGARRPGVAAWNFVVGGLLIVVLLALAQGAVLTGSVQLGGDRGLLLIGALLIGCVNYVPTRLALPVLLLTAVCGVEMYGLLTADAPFRPFVDGLLAVVPWLAWVVSRHSSRGVTALDLQWLDFRDRYGFVWGQRLREQFNRAAYHAGWPVELGWRGLRPTAGAAPPEEEVQAACLTTLRALMKRFGPANEAQ